MKPKRKKTYRLEKLKKVTSEMRRKWLTINYYSIISTHWHEPCSLVHESRPVVFELIASKLLLLELNIVVIEFHVNQTVFEQPKNEEDEKCDCNEKKKQTYNWSLAFSVISLLFQLVCISAQISSASWWVSHVWNLWTSFSIFYESFIWWIHVVRVISYINVG